MPRGPKTRRSCKKDLPTGKVYHIVALEDGMYLARRKEGILTTELDVARTFMTEWGALNYLDSLSMTGKVLKCYVNRRGRRSLAPEKEDTHE